MNEEVTDDELLSGFRLKSLRSLVGKRFTMDRDAKICYCFHVSRRKLENFVRIHRPKVPSQLSECGGAGTGCGWCIPFLREIFEASPGGELEAMSSDDYANKRAEYIRSGKGTPPSDATALPDGDS